MDDRVDLLRRQRGEMDALERSMAAWTAGLYGRMFMRLRPARQAVEALISAQPDGMMTGRQVVESPAYAALERAMLAELDEFANELAQGLVVRLQEAVRGGQAAALDKILAGMPEGARERVLTFLDVPEWMREDEESSRANNGLAG